MSLPAGKAQQTLRFDRHPPIPTKEQRRKALALALEKAKALEDTVKALEDTVKALEDTVN